MKKYIFILLVASLFLGNYVLADADAAINAAASKIDEGFSGQIVTASGGDPSNKVQSIFGEAMKIILGIIGSVALCIFIYGGIIWMTAGGTEQNISKAQNTMIWAALGLFAIFCSYMIVNYIIDKLAL